MRIFARATTLALLLGAALASATGCPTADPGDTNDTGNPDPTGDPDAGEPPDSNVPVRDPVAVKVMEWNVHNLFDETDAPYPVQDTVLTSSEVATKLSELATVIQRAQPDVLAVEEVETLALLDRLDAKLGSASLPNHALIPSGRDPRGINVGLMSKLPIVSVVSHAVDKLFSPDGRGPYYYSRDCLEVHLDIGKGREAVVLVNHQISQLDSTTETEFKREAQAKHTREIGDGLLAADPTRAVLIVGDMNDDPSSTSMSLYFSGGAFTDLEAALPATTGWTYLYNSQKLRYDYIIPDKSTATGCNPVTVLHGTDVTAASDHEPVLATCLVR